MRGRRSTRNGSTGTAARTRGSGGESGTVTNRTKGKTREGEGKEGERGCMEGRERW